MEDWNGTVMSKSSTGLGGRASMRDDMIEDFEEKDVWDSVKDIDIIQDDHSSPRMRKKLFAASGSSSSTWLNISTSTAPRMIPKRGNNTPKTTNNEAKAVVVQQSSAPMEIPDWSKIYRKNGKTSNTDHDHDHHDHGYGGDDVDYNDVNADGDDDDDDDDMVPPHEWIARKLARSQISSFSVCEGIGRRLKGRDLSKVRNAILTKTGFLE